MSRKSCKDVDALIPLVRAINAAQVVKWINSQSNLRQVPWRKHLDVSTKL